MDEKVLLDDLDSCFAEKAYLSPVRSKLLKWRVINEYPSELVEAIKAWMLGEPIPNVEYNGVSLERIQNGCKFEFVDCVELLYVLSKDPASGYDIFMRSIKRGHIR